MTSPSWNNYMAPVLRILSDGDIHQVRTIKEQAADDLQLTAEERAETIPSGELRYRNRCNWALSYLKHAAAVENVTRGSYRMTEAGRTLLANHPDTIQESDLDEIPGYDSRDSWRPNDVRTSQVVSVEPATTEELSPTEQLEDGLARIRADVAQDLLSRLLGNDPDFFERAVVDVLLAMGYGGAEKRCSVIGGTGDGGVDGVIDQDALGLDRIYVQAKRYAQGNNVGRETLQAFVGALQWRNVNRGVFITSSDFTPAAVNFANTVSMRVVLINGQRLTDLMIRYKVGVQTEKVYELPKVDEDFFEV